MTVEGEKNPRLDVFGQRERGSQEGRKMKMQHKGRQDKKRKEKKGGGGRACPANQWDRLLAGAMGDVSR